MKRTTNDLLDEYKDADFTKRLNLYLQHRELRSDFVETDRNELRSKGLDREPKSKWLPKFLTCTFEKACSCPCKA